ncbi:MAG: DUF4190 domain-containing protein [Thermoleophilia bacterium]
MECDNHPGIAATGCCGQCGRPFCRSCLIETPGRYWCPSCAAAGHIQPMSRGPSGVAVGSLALSVLSLFVCPLTAFPGAIMGFVELSRIKRGETSPEGHGLALAGAILGLVVIGVIVLGLTIIFLALAFALYNW